MDPKIVFAEKNQDSSKFGYQSKNHQSEITILAKVEFSKNGDFVRFLFFGLKL